MPGASMLLEVWETGEREHAIDRALTLLCAFTGRPRAELAALGIHQRDALLAQSRLLAFGSRLEGVAPCGECACEVEIELQLTVPPVNLPQDGVYRSPDGACVTYRVPNSHDLAAAAASGNEEECERVLRMRCIDGASSLDTATLVTVEEALEALCDPATIAFATSCPGCSAPFAPVVDIGAILWREIAAYARRLLDEVDALAGRYGWSEREILALPDTRRRRYMDGAW
jgi:hypothetical protein